MTAKLLREATLVSLKYDIENNLPLYRDGDFDFLQVDSACFFESDVEINVAETAELKNPSKGELFEPHNCKVMLSVLPTLTPYVARDERLWAMLSHTRLLKYARSRWPIPDDDAEAAKHIASHFFAANHRQLERDNVGSRLWWMGYLCKRIERNIPLEEALEVLLYRTDVRANIIERPTTAQSMPVFLALMKKLKQSFDGDRALFERKPFRDLMTHLNGLGGYKLLDVLGPARMENVIDAFKEEELKLSES